MRRSTFIVHWLLPFIMLFLLVAGGYCVWSYLQEPTTFPFKQVKVMALDNYVEPEILQHTVQNNLNGGFFSLDIQTLRATLMVLPWVSSVSIRKIWPARLIITIGEQHPVAKWRGNAIINESGQLFYPPSNTVPVSLPALSGPDDSEQQVMVLYQDLNTDMSIVGLTVKGLSLTQRLSWTVLLSNGIQVKLGRVNMQQRFKQFVQLYPRIIADKGAQVEYVDLRYPDGLAIQWKNKSLLITR